MKTRSDGRGGTARYTGFTQRPADQAREDHVGHPADGPDTAAGPAASGHPGGTRHRLMMIACCIPMLVLVGVLVATGAVGGGAIVFALACLGMMAAMVAVMPGGHRH